MLSMRVNKDDEELLCARQNSLDKTLSLCAFDLTKRRASTEQYSKTHIPAEHLVHMGVLVVDHNSWSGQAYWYARISRVPQSQVYFPTSYLVPESQHAVHDCSRLAPLRLLSKGPGLHDVGHLPFCIIKVLPACFIYAIVLPPRHVKLNRSSTLAQPS
jgi:hypothetical protein